MAPTELGPEMQGRSLRRAPLFSMPIYLGQTTAEILHL
jgi:hypothetical protein